MKQTTLHMNDWRSGRRIADAKRKEDCTHWSIRFGLPDRDGHCIAYLAFARIEERLGIVGLWRGGDIDEVFEIWAPFDGVESYEIPIGPGYRTVLDDYGSVRRMPCEPRFGELGAQVCDAALGGLVKPPR